ncbi:hypothetical protein E3O42_01000 [Cryobacterium adonitolivorans]|uniref:Uncharacterized protein n=1 Tax=Cryobacterium adonitolivorans TaxID=1259189 RepID=A0A4V3IDI2_9MICO|nr:hypothetical protein [Cryobacterium adonitolivorans]TFC06990.1 hypothetical protein E3O42_01000 [Cryobacterium adonitolivorans]
MTPDRPQGPPDHHVMDPGRSAEIRALLVRTVSATPRPRAARLSRTAFSLAATAALLFAGGIGAGTVVAYDRWSDDLVAQDASGPADASADTDVGVTAAAAEEFTPVLELNGETGYAYRSDIQEAKLAHLGATHDAVESSGDDGRVPIYRVDGVTVLGYFDPAGLTP